MYFMYLYFMYFALSVTAAVGTAGAHAQTAAGFAPANEQEFDNRFVGGRIEIIRELDVDDIPGIELLDAYVEFLPNRRFAQVAIYRYSGDHPINVEIAVIRRGDDTLLVDTGRYSYRRTVPNTGTITVVFDGGVPRIENGVYVESLFDRGDTCNTEQTFSSRVHGTFQTSGTDCAPGTGSWRLRGSDSEPEFGSRDIGDLRFIENQAITPLALPQADSGDTPLTYRVHPALPAGLTFDSGTRALSGTPTAPVARSTYSYTVTDADGDSASLTFTITVSEATVQEALTSYDNFHVIAHDLSEGQSHDAECKIQLGNGVRLADWDDIVDYHEGGGSLLEFIVGLKMSVEGQEPLPGEIASGYRISRGGEPVEGGAVRPGARHYFFARHDHRRPGYFLAHDHLDNYRLSLGSWHGTGGHALCYGKLPMVEPPQSASDHTVPFVPGASDGFRQGLVRVINHGAVAGEVRIDAFDDAGNRHGPLTLALDGGEAAQFSSGDLEDGNTAKGLTGQTGPGEGNWRLELRTDLDVEVLAYVRTADGFLTAMHDTVPGAGNRHRVALFNPGRNHSQVSLLRLVNPGGEDAEVAITGVDDAGRPAGPVNVTVPAGAAQTFSAQDLESGGGRLSGALGAGAGKWRLTVVPSQPVFVMNLLRSPTGHLANLSTTAAVGSGGTHVLPLIPAKSTSGREGFVRVVNRSGRAGEVRIAAFDDAGQEYGPLTLALAADAAVHLSSDDLEDGNAAKGLTGRTGPGEGDWRLDLRSDLDIEALAYIRTDDGFLTAMHDVAPSREQHRSIAIFNPGSNRIQVSLLRLINPATVTAHVTITGIDDAGEAGGSVQVSIPAGAARTFSAQQLESGEGTQGMLDDGAGKWRLEVASEQPIIAMSLLESPTGHLTNLSTVRVPRVNATGDVVILEPDEDRLYQAQHDVPLVLEFRAEVSRLEILDASGDVVFRASDLESPFSSSIRSANLAHGPNALTLVARFSDGTSVSKSITVNLQKEPRPEASPETSVPFRLQESGLEPVENDIRLDVGERARFMVSNTYPDGFVQTCTEALSIDVSDQRILSVERNQVTAIAPGTTRIALTCAGETHRTDVNVDEPALRGIRIEPDYLLILGVGTEVELEVTEFRMSGPPRPSRSASLTVEDTALLAVADTTVTALRAGRTSLTAEVDGATDTIEVEVVEDLGSNRGTVSVRGGGVLSDDRSFGSATVSARLIVRPDTVSHDGEVRFEVVDPDDLPAPADEEAAFAAVDIVSAGAFERNAIIRFDNSFSLPKGAPVTLSRLDDGGSRYRRIGFASVTESRIEAYVPGGGTHVLHAPRVALQPLRQRSSPGPAGSARSSDACDISRKDPRPRGASLVMPRKTWKAGSDLSACDQAWSNPSSRHFKLLQQYRPALQVKGWHWRGTSSSLGGELPMRISDLVRQGQLVDTRFLNEDIEHPDAQTIGEQEAKELLQKQ